LFVPGLWIQQTGREVRWSDGVTITRGSIDQIGDLRQWRPVGEGTLVRSSGAERCEHRPDFSSRLDDGDGPQQSAVKPERTSNQPGKGEHDVPVGHRGAHLVGDQGAFSRTPSVLNWGHTLD
jgi:hypothetical protein